MTWYEAQELFPYMGTGKAGELRECLSGIRDITDRVKGDSSISRLSERELLDILTRSEKVCLAVRQALCSKWLLPYRDPAEPVACPLPGFRALPVKADFSGGILTVSCPPTFLRKLNDSWMPARYVKAALAVLCEERGRPVIPQPAYVLCVRKATAYRSAYRDNENYETSRVINEVMECLGYTDRPDHLGYISIFRTVADASESGVDLIFLSASMLRQHPELLDF